MIYIVSSLPRSGSSMMMRCLEAGGMPCKYDKSQEALNIYFGDDGYQPNGNGFYALNVDWTVPQDMSLYQSQIIKVQANYLHYLPQGQYKIIMLRRDPDEILLSMQRFQPGFWGDMQAVVLDDEYFNCLYKSLNLRGDMQFLELEYADVVADPKTAFNSILNFGFQISVDNAVKMVDPSLYRFKMENS